MSVSMYSVDSLRQLVGKLLARAKLTPDSFSDHEDALKPFISIMKQCGNSTIRELTADRAPGGLRPGRRRGGGGRRG